METVQSILMSMTTGTWCTSVDLKDAFLDVPIAVRHRRFLRFRVGLLHYQFRALPFGLTTSPYVFTRIIKAVLGSYVHSRGRLLIQHLDDWNLAQPSPRESSTCTDWLVKLTGCLGLLVNSEKSDLIPRQIFTFVGVIFDLILGIARPADHRVDNLLNLCRSFCRLSQPPAALWQQLLGHLTSLERLVPLGRLYMRPLQFALHSQWRQLVDSPSTLVEPDLDCRLALQWWTDPVNLNRGVPLRRPEPQLRLFTDASNHG